MSNLIRNRFMLSLNNWAEFVLKRLEKKEDKRHAFPLKNGIAQFKTAHYLIIELLETNISNDHEKKQM